MRTKVVSKKKISFKIKVLLPIVTIFIVSVLVMSAMNYRLLDSAVKTKTNANLDIFTDNVLTEIKHLDIMFDITKQMLNKRHIETAEVVDRLQGEVNIETIVREAKIGFTGYGIVLSGGFVSAHPDDDLLGKDVTEEGWYKAVSSGDGFAWIDIDNEKYYAGYKNEKNTTVIGLVSEKNFYEELNQMLVKTLGFLFLAIIIMVAVVYLFLGKMLMPIGHLVKGLKEIAKGNLDVRIEGSYNNEFDEIKDAVNSMAADIKTHVNVISGIEYASKIQENLLPPDSAFKEVFSDYHVIWKPRDIVGGDIYWIKNFEKGTVLCVCDCTGHGTPGALLTVLVVSALEAVVRPNNCAAPADIIWRIDERLVQVFEGRKTSDSDIKDGCDIAVLFIAKNGNVTLSSGHINVFVCNGKEVQRIKGQKIFVGEGNLNSKDDIKTMQIPANPANKFYIASDGLFDQPGGAMSRPFGYSAFERIILESHAEKQSAISDKIWAAFEEYRGAEPRVDDFELIMFKPQEGIV